MLFVSSNVLQGKIDFLNQNTRVIAAPNIPRPAFDESHAIAWVIAPPCRFHLPGLPPPSVFFLSPLAAIARLRSRSFSRILIFSSKLSDLIRARSFGLLMNFLNIVLQTASTSNLIRAVREYCVVSFYQPRPALRIAKLCCGPWPALSAARWQPSVLRS